VPATRGNQERDQGKKERPPPSLGKGGNRDFLQTRSSPAKGKTAIGHSGMGEITISPHNNNGRGFPQATRFRESKPGARDVGESVREKFPQAGRKRGFGLDDVAQGKEHIWQGRQESLMANASLRRGKKDSSPGKDFG